MKIQRKIEFFIFLTPWKSVRDRFSVSVVIKLFYLSAEILPEEEEKASTEKCLMKNYRMYKKNNKFEKKN